MANKTTVLRYEINTFKHLFFINILTNVFNYDIIIITKTKLMEVLLWKKITV